VATNQVRLSYSSVAACSQILFFVSLPWRIRACGPIQQQSIHLFILSIKQSEKGRDVKKRLFPLTSLILVSQCLSQETEHNGGMVEPKAVG
jgi:hypothetical protein